MTNKIGCCDCARPEALIFNPLFLLYPSTPAVLYPPPQPVTATLWVLPARPATRPQASAPARTASLESPATAAPRVTSRAAPPSPPASVSHKHTHKTISRWIKKLLMSQLCLRKQRLVANVTGFLMPCVMQVMHARM